VKLQQLSDISRKEESQYMKMLGPKDSVCAVNVAFSALAIRIGFDDSLLISRALACLTKAQEAAAGEIGAEDASTNSDNDAEDSADADSGAVTSAAASSKMLIIANVNIPIVVVDLINDLGRRQLPLLQLRIRKFAVGVKMVEDYIDADVLLAMSAVYYNEKLTVWEPMLEPWGCVVLFNKEPNTTKDEVLRINDTRTTISVTAEQRLDLNLTVELVQLLMENMVC